MFWAVCCLFTGHFLSTLIRAEAVGSPDGRASRRPWSGFRAGLERGRMVITTCIVTNGQLPRQADKYICKRRSSRRTDDRLWSGRAGYAVPGLWSSTHDGDRPRRMDFRPTRRKRSGADAGDASRLPFFEQLPCSRPLVSARGLR